MLPPQLVGGQVVALVHPKARQNTSIIHLAFLTVQGLKRLYRKRPTGFCCRLIGSNFPLPPLSCHAVNDPTWSYRTMPFSANSNMAKIVPLSNNLQQKHAFCRLSLVYFHTEEPSPPPQPHMRQELAKEDIATLLSLVLAPC